MSANHQTDKVNNSKRAILSDLLQGQLTVEQVIEQKLFASESEILDAVVELIDEVQRYRYVNKIEPQLSGPSPKPVVSRLPVAHAEVASFALMPPPAAPQAAVTQAPESARQKPNRSLTVGRYEQALGLSFPDTLHSLSDFQMFVVDKIREQRLTLQTALDAEIFMFAGMAEFTLAEQGAMISDNAGNYIGATKLSEEMNMIHTQGRGDHIADGVTNDIQSEHNKEKTEQDCETQKEYDEFEENQDEQNDESAMHTRQANMDKELAHDKYEKTKIVEQAEANKQQTRHKREERVDEAALSDIIGYSSTPSNTK